MTRTEAATPGGRAGGDLIAGAVTVAAILLFVATGSAVLADVVRGMAGYQRQHDASLTIALLLNIAVLLFGWHRHRTARAVAIADAAVAARAPFPATRDPLTGLLNRRGLGEDGAALLATAGRRGKAVALLVLDLDHPRGIGDAQSHAFGNALLREAATTITGVLPPSALAGRLDGDGFACAVVFDPGIPDTVGAIAEQLLSNLSRSLEIEGRQIHVAAALGIARSDQDGAGIDGLLRAAGIALAAARRVGRNRLTWFDQAMEQEVQARTELEHGLRAAIPAGEIVPWFEPQVALADGRLIGFEVLARWQHPRHGIIEPHRFITLAEQAGLIAELSLSVIRQALLAAREWDPALTIAVNLAPAQLRDAWLAQKLIKLLSETGFPARRLQVEVTESALIDNLPLAQSIAGSLKNQGIGLALDDFGTGYSSIAHLRALPFDTIKIDTSFVLSMADSADSAAIVTAIAGLGDSLNLPITAEGVETQAAEERLRALGITKAQGWRYGKPMPLTGVRRLLAEKRMLATPDESFRSRRLAG